MLSSRTATPGLLVLPASCLALTRPILYAVHPLHPRLKAILQTIADGLIWGRTTYLMRSGENRFEFVVIAAFWADFALWNFNITFIRFLPAIYALRPFKLLMAYDGTRVRARAGNCGSSTHSG